MMAAQGHTGLKRFLPGRTAAAVIRRAPCPVLAVRPCGRDLMRGAPVTNPGGIRNILVPVDFSDRSRSLNPSWAARTPACSGTASAPFQYWANPSNQPTQ